MLVIDNPDGVGIDTLDEVLINVLTSEAVDIDMLVGVGIIVLVASAGIDLEFAVSVSYAVDVTSGVAVDLFVEAWVLDVLTGIGIALLLWADMNANAIAVVMTALEFPVSAPLEWLCR